MKKKAMRTRKLIEPRLQLLITAWFVGLAAFALVFQYILFTSEMAELATTLAPERAEVLESFSSAFGRVLLISLGVVLPLTAFVGVLATFKVAGPIYAMRRYLTSLRAGEDPGVLRLRKNDQLQDFCTLLQEVTGTETRGAEDTEQRAA